MQTKFLFILSVLPLSVALLSCQQHRQPVVTPWGTEIGADCDSVAAGSGMTLDDIVSGGELIMLTLSGPDNYFDYHGRGMGTQYLLCEKFAQKIGVSLRVELCKDTADMVGRLQRGDGDIAVCQIPKGFRGGVLMCGAATDSTSWAVAAGNSQLADTLNRWYSPALLAQVKREERYAYSAASVRRHVYAPMLDASRGEISQYDHLFKAYAPTVRWDWRLMAAQCYQESTFDPKAYSWAGARGLMQIMPSTAASLGLREADMYNPEANIAAAARYLVKLNGLFADVRNYNERINYMLASYNGGHFHVRDAMALARKHGRNPYRWADVEEFVLKLSSPTFYSDPVVKYGYMRGSETVDYVARIRDRWDKYRHKAGGGSMLGPSTGAPSHSLSPSGSYEPQKARRKNKYKI